MANKFVVITLKNTVGFTRTWSGNCSGTPSEIYQTAVIAAAKLFSFGASADDLSVVLYTTETIPATRSKKAIGNEDTTSQRAKRTTKIE